MLDMTQAQLALAAGVSCRTVNIYEQSSDQAPPSAKIGTYSKVVDALTTKGIRFAPNGVALVAPPPITSPSNERPTL
jgi:hypothetical protein